MIADGPTAYITGPDGLPLEQIDAAGTAPTVENPFQFAGQYTDAKTGLQDLRARYYDPATGQFLSRDPLEDTTLHPFAYADNDPTNATDPSGLSAWSTVSDAAAGALDGLTGGYSTKLAASLLDFNLDCADFGAGFSALRTATFVGSLADGEGGLALAARLGIKEAQAAKGAERTLGPRFAPGKWLPHFEKHAAEFGYKNSVEYLKGARDLVGREGVQTFTGSNGDRLFYDAARNEFAAMKPDGVLRTYFRPKNGSSYWQGQTGG